VTTCLQFSPRIPLNDLFTVVPDSTAWDGHYDNVPKEYEGNSLVRTPRRPLATFGTAGRSMTLLPGKALPHAYGVYVIGLLEPHPAVYVGIAAEGGKEPEGILKRLQKHRVKISGSHVHVAANAGGIHHPVQWGSFASLRHKEIVTPATPDTLRDVVIMTGSLGPGANLKSALGPYEGALCRPTDARRALIRAVFGSELTDVYSLNSTKGKRSPAPSSSVRFDGHPDVFL